MPIGEAIRLTEVLSADLSSHLCASLNGLKYPWPREADVMANLFDLVGSALAGKKHKPYPRPWQGQRTKKLGNAGGRSRAEVVELLARMRAGQLA